MTATATAATFGGPIIKNKLFFFTNFERQGISLTATAGGQVLTPTAAGLAQRSHRSECQRHQFWGIPDNMCLWRPRLPVAVASRSTVRRVPVRPSVPLALPQWRLCRGNSSDRRGFGRESRISEFQKLRPECRLQHLFPRSAPRPLHLQQAGQGRPGCKPCGLLHHRAFPFSPLYPRRVPYLHPIGHQ